MAANKVNGRIPNSTDVIEQYKNIVENMATISTLIVKADLNKSGLKNIVKFNKSLKKISKAIVKGIENLSDIAKAADLYQFDVKIVSITNSLVKSCKAIAELTTAIQNVDLNTLDKILVIYNKIGSVIIWITDNVSNIKYRIFKNKLRILWKYIYRIERFFFKINETYNDDVIKNSGDAVRSVALALTYICDAVTQLTKIKFGDVRRARRGLRRVKRFWNTSLKFLKHIAEADLSNMKTVSQNMNRVIITVIRIKELMLISTFGVTLGVAASMGMITTRWFLRATRKTLQILFTLMPFPPSAYINTTITLLKVFSTINLVMLLAISGGVLGVAAMIAVWGIWLFFVSFKKVLSLIQRMDIKITISEIVLWKLAALISILTLNVVALATVGYFIVQYGVLMLGAILFYIVVVGAMVTTLWLLNKFQADINKGIMELMLIGIAFFVFTLGLVGICAMIGDERDKWQQDLIVLGVVISLMAGSIIFLSYFKGQVWQGSIQLLILGGAFAAFSASLVLIAMSLKLADVGWLLLTITVLTTIIIPLLLAICIAAGVPPISEFAAAGAIVLAIIGTAMIAFATAMLIAALALNMIELEDVQKLPEIMGWLSISFAIAGAMLPLIVIGTAAFSAIGVSLIPFCLGLILVSKVLNVVNLDDIKKLSDILPELSHAYITAGAMMPLIVIGSVAFIAIAVSLLPFALTLMTSSIILMGLQEDQFSKLATVTGILGGVYSIAAVLGPSFIIGSVIFLLASGSLLPFTLTLLAAHLMLLAVQTEQFSKLAAITGITAGVFAIMATCAPLVVIGSYVMMFASAAILTFTKALMSINKAAEGLDEERIKKVIESSKIIVDTVANLDINYGKVAKAIIKMSLLNKVAVQVAYMAETISRIAKLQIPDGWNEKGKPIHYRELNSADFSNAAANVLIITTSLLSCIIQVDQQENIEDKVKKAKKVFKKLRPVVRTLSGMAKVIADLASRQIADRWDKNGNPVHYRELNDADFKRANKAVSDIMTNVIKAITDDKLQKILDNAKKKHAKILKKYFDAFGNIDKIVDPVCKLATLQIPIEWNALGHPRKYRKLSDKELKAATTNIATIIKTVCESLSNEKLKELLEKTDKATAQVMGEFFNQMGNVTSIVDLVVKLAQGSYVIEFNEKTGKPTKYGTFEQLLGGGKEEQIATNIASILKCVINGMNEAFEKIDKKQLTDLDEKVKGIQGIADPLDKSIDAIIKISENKAFKNFDQEVYSTKLKDLMSAVLSPFKDDTIFNASDISKVEKKLTTLDDCASIIKSLSEIDSGKSNGTLKRATDATNNFLTKLNSVDQNKLDKMAKIAESMEKFSSSINGNFDALADALSNKIVKVLEELNDTLNGVSDKLSGVSEAIVEPPKQSASATIDQKQQKEDPSIKKSLKEIAEMLRMQGVKVKEVSGTVKAKVVNPYEII